MVDTFLKDLETLVNIDSGSGHAEGIAKVANFFADRYAKLGFTVTTPVFNEKLGPCLEVRTDGGDEFDVLIVGHMDTVFPEGTASERPFSIVDDRAYGPGVIDMRSCMLLAESALTDLLADGRLPRVCVAYNCDEEIGSPSSSQWLSSLAKASRCVLVVEPARVDGSLVLERKGGSSLELEFQGKAAHAGVEPEKGRSAITELAHWVLALNELNDYEKGTTLNVGVAQGGSTVNVVPDSAKASVDFRFRTEKEYMRVQDRLQELLQGSFVEGVTAHMTEEHLRQPMSPTDKTEKLCRLVERIGKEINLNITWAKTGGGSDGNTTAALGVPTLDGLGPVGGKSHSVEEYLEIPSIEPRLKLLTELIARAPELEL